MEFRQLQTFVIITHAESFSRAAELLGYSQSAVTVQIRLLEEELQVRLFDRMGKKTVLTAQGRQLLEYANRIIQEVNQAKSAIVQDTELSERSMWEPWSPCAFPSCRRCWGISAAITPRCR